ncbi:MAG: hypothetical protein CVU84_06035 [Firmicutes bacterium HGW-Firmicutes-1]|jgi:chemotaxis methyl-accepting protein methylase|nr:MAG: hypothetical protein CVU84_06035 [Firmicutes bacterium HGW-Firmicutes-1]
MNKELSKIITVMKLTYERDISIYDEAFIMNALERRCIVIGAINADQYCNFLEKNKNEADHFFGSLHITFSQFFRDSITFAALEQNVFHNIIAHKPEGSEIRIWSAGCSSGQEAYSIAMLLSEISEARGHQIRFRIFATDISKEALADGIAGVYDQHAVQNVKLKQLNKYFTKQGNTYTIIPELRQCVNFSTYDLLDPSTANPPESIYGDFDIVICCNVLIYYKPNLQQLIIKKLQQALSTFGYLVTDESEKMLVQNCAKVQNIEIPTTVFENKIGRGV